MDKTDAPRDTPHVTIASPSSARARVSVLTIAQFLERVPPEEVGRAEAAAI